MAGPSLDEMREQENRASDQVMEGGSKYPAMTYEEGVVAALLWVLGEGDEKPMED